MTAYLLSPESKKLFPEVYKGKLVYRIKGSSKRISYQTIKKELVCKSFYMNEEIPFNQYQTSPISSPLKIESLER